MRENRIAEFKDVEFVAETMCQVTVRTADEWRVRIGHFVVIMILKSRFADGVLMAFGACFVLSRDDDNCRLARRACVIAQRVPRSNAQNLSASKRPFAAVAIDTLDFFFAMMKRGQVLRRFLCVGAQKALEILRFRLGVTRRAKSVILLLLRDKRDPADEREQPHYRAKREQSPTREMHFWLNHRDILCVVGSYPLKSSTIECI